MAQYKPPSPLNFQEPNWDRFLAQYETFRLLTELDKKPGNIQVASLKYCMGPEAEDIIKTFNLSDTELLDYKVVVDKFKSYFNPRRNVLRLRRQFYRRTQQPTEDSEAYLRALYLAAEYCEFNDKKESIRDQFVTGILEDELAEKIELLYYAKDGKLTLDDVVEYSRTYNDVHYGRKMERESCSAPREVSAVQREPTYKPPRNVVSEQGQGKTGRSTQKWCRYCGRSHAPRKCPAYGKTCIKCRKQNHFAAVCSQVAAVESVGPEEQSQDGSAAGAEYSDVRGFLGEVQTTNKKTRARNVILEAMGQEVEFKVDTGADVTVVNSNAASRLRDCGLGRIVPADRQLICPSGKLKVQGMVSVPLQYKGKNIIEKVYVLEKGNPCSNLLSRDASVELGLVSFVGGVELTRDIFGFGLWDTAPVKLSMIEGGLPHRVYAARNIAIPLLPATKKTLESLEASQVIEKVTHPTDWVSPIVPVVKKGSNPLEVRLCVDYKHLNKNLRREIYGIPTFEELCSQFKGAKVFSKLDAKSGFYQIPLEERSRDVTTFITPFGRYRYKRLPMGISVAPEIFQRKMEELLDGLPGVVCYMDDVVVFGTNKEEHDRHLAGVIARIVQSGLRLNEEKCMFHVNSIDFLGHTIDQHGIKISPGKVRAILDLAAPKDLKELQSMLGLIKYLVRFLPGLHKVMEPLSTLLSKKCTWAWDSAQQNAFNSIKRIITTAPVLSYFDPSKPTRVSADASSYGLGGVLMQLHGKIWKPVAFCSRKLLENERRWSQIEKECLAVVWACERFRQYILGIQVQVETDHKPLIPLINTKALSAVPVRCQRLLMRLAEYSVQASYTPGKYMAVADALSRQPTVESDTEPADTMEIEEHVEAIVQMLPASANQIKEIKRQQLLDRDLSRVIEHTLEGWQNMTLQLDPALTAYWADRSHLSLVDGTLLLYNDRIVIPATMRKEMLHRIHSDGHLSLDKSRSRAQESVWWPGLSRELKAWVEGCTFCQRHSRQHRAEPLRSTLLPERPWTRVGMDLCLHEGSSYLVVVDYFSRWLEIVRLQELNSTHLVGKLKNMFSKFGIPEVVVSDNGPQFQSAVFKQFAMDYGFDHVTSNPHYPQENGCAERAVQTAKRILSQEDVFLALMSYRSTPLDTTGYSPAHLLMGRQLRTRLPVVKAKLTPKWPDLRRVAEQDAKSKLASATAYNRSHGARQLPSIPVGAPVLMRNPSTERWDPLASSIGYRHGDRSYVVRNRRHLKPVVPDSNRVPIISSPEATPQPQVIEKPIVSEELGGQQTSPTLLETPEELPVIPERPLRSPAPTRTRSGRIVQAPRKLNL